MAKFDWDALSADLVEAMGGKENIKSFQHCATRFRFYALNDKKVSKSKLGKVKLAKGVNKEGSQWQVIFGAGTVNKVHDHFATYVGGGNAKAAPQPKKPRWDPESSFGSNIFTNLRSAIRAFADIFIPLIPVFIAGGLALAFSSLIGQFGDQNSASMKSARSYLDLIGGGILGSLPAFVGYTAMKKFGGTPMLGLAIGIIMVGPSLLNGWVSSSNYITHAFGASDDHIAFLKDDYARTHMPKLFAVWTDHTKLAQALTHSAGHTVTVTTAGSYDASAHTFTAAKTSIGDLSLAGFTANQGSTIGATPALFPNAPTFFQFGFVGYQAQVFPTLGIIAVAYWIERGMKRISPEAIAIISVPIVTVFLSLFLGFLIVGPAGRYLGLWITEAFQGLFKWTNWPGFGLGGALLGAAYPFLVVTGLHQGFVPVEASIVAETSATYHHAFTWITAVGSVSNVAQGMVGATLAVMLWKKSPKAGTTAMSGAVSANLGITEPILFGVNLPIKFGILAASAASFIGGYWVGMTHTVANSLGSASWLGLIAQFDYKLDPSYATYIADNGFHTTPGLDKLAPIVNESIALGLTTVAAIGFTTLFGKTFGKKAFSNYVAEQNAEETVETTNSSSLNSVIQVKSPIKGSFKKVTQAKDKVFKTKALGDGIVFFPTEGEVVSPVEGKITMIFPTKHAYGIVTKDGTEFLIHIGIDSTKVNFKTKLKPGSKVKVGTTIAQFDMTEFKSKSKSTESLLSISADKVNGRKFVFAKAGKVKQGDNLFSLEIPKVKSAKKATTKKISVVK